MGRFVSPVLFICAAAYVFWFNANHTDAVVMLPMMDMLYPPSAGDPALQGKVTGVFFAALGAVLFGFALWRTARERGQSVDG